MKRVIRLVTLLSVGALGTAACGGDDTGGGNGGGGSGNAGGANGGGAGGAGGSATGGASSGGGGTGGTAVGCTTDADCEAKLPATEPLNCAAANCDLVLKTCNFIAKDEDGDGHAAAQCKAIGSGSVDTGDDCDDTDKNVYPGSTATPCTAGLGECLASGVETCINGVAGCSAKPGAPSPDSPLCDGKDHDCDGTPNTGCGCSAGQKQTCHANDPDACNKVELVCSNGTWPTCPSVVKKKEYCRDYDKDGYCELLTQCGNMACSAPDDTWKLKASCQATTDCKDTAADVNPGAPETCGDGSDKNCNGADSDGFDFGACSVGTPGSACYRSGNKTCAGTAGTSCNLTVGTAQDSWHTTQYQDGAYVSWDWNCNGVVDVQYKLEAGLWACAWMPDSATCYNYANGEHYYVKAPGAGDGCGQALKKVKCTWTGTECTQSSIQDVLQGCK